MKITLRGHHLLCLNGFQGYGYSKDFVENMHKVNTIRKSEKTSVKLTAAPDDICKSCPNLKEGLCENTVQNKRIIEMDSEVLSKFDKSKEYNSIELFKQVSDIFKSKEDVEKICYKCMWHDKCLFYQNL